MHAGEKMFKDIVNRAANTTPVSELVRMNEENGTTFETNNGEITDVIAGSEHESEEIDER